MNRKILALVLALLAVTAAIVAAVILCDTPGGGADETFPNQAGIEDSIFDSDPVETKAPVETAAPDVTEDTVPVPGSTIPDGPADTDVGLQNPDVDVPSETIQPSQTEPAVTEPVATEPQQPQPTEPAETEPAQIPEGELDYETFVALDPAVQRAYMESFESMDAFFEWYNAAKETYEQEHPALDVGDGVIDVEDLLGQGS